MNVGYLTPTGVLSTNMVYVIAVSSSVTDDTMFPSSGTPLNKTAGAPNGQPYYATFTVTTPAVGPGHSPFTITSTSPGDITEVTQPLGYGTVTFSEPLSFTPQTFGRFAAMIVPQTGGVTTGTSDYADVPYNAKLAFNPNTNTLVIVPTGQMTNDVLNVFALAVRPRSRRRTVTC